MSDVVLLRKLTEKSILKFGKYSDIKIRNILIAKNYDYLRWVYFNCSNITFIDEIIEQLNIPEEFLINKPATNIDFYVKLKELNSLKISSKSKEVFDIKVEEENSKKRKMKAKLEKIYFSKGMMQNRNHGRK